MHPPILPIVQTYNQCSIMRLWKLSQS